MIRMCIYKFLKLIGGAAVSQRTTGGKVRNKDPFQGAQYLCCLTHEVNTAEHNDIGSGLCSPLSKGKTVSHKIGNILNFRFLVIVRQNNGVFLFPEFIYVLNDFFFDHLFIIYIVLKFEKIYDDNDSMLTVSMNFFTNNLMCTLLTSQHRLSTVINNQNICKYMINNLL